MADPTLLTALCAAAESVVNGALRFDPGSRQALGRLEGRVLAVEVTRPAMRFYLLPHGDGLAIHSHHDGEADSCIKGSPLALMSLLQSERLNLADSGVEVFGGTGLLSELQDIAGNLDIDWEDALGRIIGDVAAHQGANAIRGFSGWLEGRRATFERLLGEYLSEELQTTPARAELEHYYREVDELRLATDRLAARIEALRNNN